MVTVGQVATESFLWRCAISCLWGWSCLWCGGPGQSSGFAVLYPGISFTGIVLVFCTGLQQSRLRGEWKWVTSLLSHCETAAEIQLLAHAVSFPEVHVKNFPFLHFGQKNFLRCYFSQGLFVIEMYPFSNRCMVYFCSNYRRCCPFHLCLCNSVWHHVIKVYVLCSLSSLLISLAFSLAIQNQYHCSFLNKKWTVEQGPNAHTDNLQQLDAVLTNDHPTGW